MTPWTQQYDPLGSAVLSTLVALLPVVVLLGLLASHKVRAHWAALAGLAAALLVAIVGIGMPTGLALRAAAYGAAYGLFPIGWILLNVLFLFQLSVGGGQWAVLPTAYCRLITAALSSPCRGRRTPRATSSRNAGPR